jgi:uncharacterized protein (TIRG00374 family)
MKGWHLKALILSVVAAAGGYLVFSLWGGWQDVVGAFSRIGLVGVLVALPLSLVNYALRFGRWQLYLSRLGYQLETLASARIYLGGFALTTTPGKAGEAFRGVLLKCHDIPFRVTLAALISERLSDLMAIVLLALVGLSQFPGMHGVVVTGILAVIVVLALLSSRTMLEHVHRWILRRDGRLMTAASHLVSALGHARRCSTSGLMAVTTIISLSAWGAEAVAFYWILNLLEADISLATAAFVFALSMLAGALSFMPGGLGGTEAAMVSLLVVNGMSTPESVAATVFIRLTTLWFAVCIGLVALYRSRHGERLVVMKEPGKEAEGNDPGDSRGP